MAGREGEEEKTLRVPVRESNEQQPFEPSLALASSASVTEKLQQAISVQLAAARSRIILKIAAENHGALELVRIFLQYLHDPYKKWNDRWDAFVFLNSCIGAEFIAQALDEATLKETFNVVKFATGSHDMIAFALDIISYYYKLTGKILSVEETSILAKEMNPEKRKEAYVREKAAAVLIAAGESSKVAPILADWHARYNGISYLPTGAGEPENKEGRFEYMVAAYFRKIRYSLPNQTGLYVRRDTRAGKTDSLFMAYNPYCPALEAYMSWAIREGAYDLLTFTFGKQNRYWLATINNAPYSGNPRYLELPGSFNAARPNALYAVVKNWPKRKGDYGHANGILLSDIIVRDGGMDFNLGGMVIDPGADTSEVFKLGRHSNLLLTVKNIARDKDIIIAGKHHKVNVEDITWQWLRNKLQASATHVASSVVTLSPLNKIKVFIDDLTFTLVDIKEDAEHQKYAVTPDGLVDFYNKKLRAGAIQVIDTGDRFEDAMKWWVSRLSPDVLSRVVILSSSSMQAHRIKENGEPEVIFSLVDFVAPKQREHWQEFYQEWLSIMKSAAEIYYGGFNSILKNGKTYLYKIGTVDDRNGQITLSTTDAQRDITLQEADEINAKLNASGVKLSVKVGENRRDAIKLYLEQAFAAAKFTELGFNPRMIPVREVTIDATPIPWNKGKGLQELKKRRALETLFNTTIDWPKEAEMHGDGFASSNDRLMAQALPQTPAVSVGYEDQANVPDNVLAYRG
ncbi:MAG: hypothetical protein WC330_04395, partial [Candidatus Omnitrophota bacterium]